MATAISLALDNGAKATFPQLLTMTKNDIPKHSTTVFWRVNTDAFDSAIAYTYEEPRFNFSPIPYQPNMKIVGWFQTEKYFKHHKEEIIDLFSPSEEILEYLEEKYGKLIHNKKAVAVHVRCYLSEDKRLSKRFPIYGKEYYLKVMSKFPKGTLFVFFSDNIAYCKRAFSKTKYKVVFIENEESYSDLYHLSLYKRMIISNSTFAWWAAYLNTHPDKSVIAPPKWIYAKKGDDSDVIPEEWIQSLDDKKSKGVSNV